MKQKIAKLLFILIVGISLNSQAQNRVGAGLAYGTEIENVGINANAQFFVRDNIAVAPGIVYFFPKELGSSGIDFKWFDINVNGHYYFQTGAVQPYALAGLNFAILSVDSSFGDSSNTEVGLNLGGGVNFEVGNVLPFGEIRLVVGNADQVVFAGGVRFNISG